MRSTIVSRWFSASNGFVSSLNSPEHAPAERDPRVRGQDVEVGPDHGKLAERFEPFRREHVIGADEACIVSRGRLNAGVHGGRRTSVLAAQESHLRSERLDGGREVVGGAVIDDDDLGSGHGLTEYRPDGVTDHVRHLICGDYDGETRCRVQRSDRPGGRRGEDLPGGAGSRIG